MRTLYFGLSGLILGLVVQAPACAQTCDAYFTKSQSIAGVVSDAFTAMNAKDAGSYSKVLPGLESALNALPSTEVKAEACGTHINAYTTHQYAELSILRAHGVDVGMPANLPIVKQPDLNQVSLAYATGWIKYEQGNFDGALAAYAKGLAMFPNEPNLENEYLATLLELKRYKDVTDFADKVLNGSYNLDDVARAKVYLARAMGLWGLNDLDGADDALTVSLRYNETDDAKDTQAKVRDAKAKKN